MDERLAMGKGFWSFSVFASDFQLVPTLQNTKAVALMSWFQVVAINIQSDFQKTPRKCCQFIWRQELKGLPRWRTRDRKFLFAIRKLQFSPPWGLRTSPNHIHRLPCGQFLLIVSALFENDCHITSSVEFNSTFTIFRFHFCQQNAEKLETATLVWIFHKHTQRKHPKLSKVLGPHVFFISHSAKSQSMSKLSEFLTISKKIWQDWRKGHFAHALWLQRLFLFPKLKSSEGAAPEINSAVWIRNRVRSSYSTECFLMFCHLFSQLDSLKLEVQLEIQKQLR